jgi:hypothetical protein
MSNKRPDDDFTPQEKQERFEATLRGALKTPPQPRPVTQKKKADRPASSDACAATGETAPPES